MGCNCGGSKKRPAATERPARQEPEVKNLGAKGNSEPTPSAPLPAVNRG